VAAEVDSLRSPATYLSVTLFEKMPLQQALAAGNPIMENPTPDNQLNLFTI